MTKSLDEALGEFQVSPNAETALAFGYAINEAAEAKDPRSMQCIIEYGTRMKALMDKPAIQGLSRDALRRLLKSHSVLGPLTAAYAEDTTKANAEALVRAVAVHTEVGFKAFSAVMNVAKHTMTEPEIEAQVDAALASYKVEDVIADAQREAASDVDNRA
jgi:hypothetical protein